MRWIKPLSKRRRRDEPTAAQQALAEALEAHREVEQRRPAVLAVVARIKAARQENHLAERIEAAYAARRGAPQ
ncbi:hypothetical protein [Streptomyces sp. PD-S100-1]|uniref:DUF7620 family protein n=1 Tax=Streptomyces sp. PD-S100-1 TaxID=3394351 RepID=UPI0039BD0F08